MDRVSAIKIYYYYYYSMSVNSFIANVIVYCKNRRLNKCFILILILILILSKTI